MSPIRTLLLLAALIPMLSPAAYAQQVAEAGQHTLNLKDADIHTLIATVSEITGRNFIVDPRVEAQVTVISASPMDSEELWNVFVSVLRTHGYALVDAGSMTKILPEAVARQEGNPPAPPSGSSVSRDQLVTRMINVEHLAASELEPILRPLLPAQAQLTTHAASNSLVITDRAGNVDRLVELVRRIDTASDVEIEVIPLRHASAAELSRTVALLGQAGGNGAQRVIADERTNSILLSGERSSRLRMRALISHLDTPIESGDTQVIYLRYAQADSMMTIIEGVARSLMGAAEGAAPSIQAHTETNSLIVTAPPAVYRSLREVVRQLDVRRAQVLIEAVIAEVSEEVADELGVQWQATRDNFDGSGIIGGTNFPGSSAGGGIIGLAADPRGLASLGGLNLGYVGGSVTLPGSDTPILQLGALVRALRGDARSNILSTPSIVTLDHQEAEISVGQEIPFLQGEFTGAGNNDQINPFRTVDRREVGLRLTVTPHVNEGDSIVLDIDNEVSSLAPRPAGAVDLVTNKRTLRTTVMVGDGNMLVLGGLIDEDVSDTVQKVPGLGDIPVLGNLFRTRSRARLKRNLMVFLRPQILRDAFDENRVSSDKYNYIRAEQINARQREGSIGDATDQPLLPELSDFLMLPPPQAQPRPLPEQ